MKNHEYVRQLSVKELAELLLRSRTVQDYDENFDGDWECCGEYEMFVTPNGIETTDYEDAIQYTMDWLNAEREQHKETAYDRCDE